MKYKVGDIVTIKSKEWYDENKDGDECIEFSAGCFSLPMSAYCGRDAMVSRVYEYTYGVDIDGGLWNWTDEMFEEEEKSIDHSFVFTGMDNSVQGSPGKVISAPGNYFDTAFFCGDKAVITFLNNGDILVHGKFVENDKEVVEAFREFLGIKKE